MADIKIIKERKFHDAWAFYLFAAFAIGMNTFFLLNSTNIFQEVEKGISTYKFFACFFSNLGFTIGLILLSLLMCFLIPKVLIVGSVFAIPVVSAISFFKFDLANNPNATVIGISMFLINLIFLIMAGFMILSSLTYISLALKAGSKIFFENFFSILAIQIACFLLFFISLIPVALVNADNDVIKALRYMIVLYFCWAWTILSYFMEVLISSIVFFHIKKDESGVIGNSLTNSFYAMGSIAFGALLIAVITTLKVMLASSRSEQPGEKRNIFSVIVSAIAKVLLDILGEIVKFANNIAYPYLAVSGTGYQESVAQSFQVLTSSGYEKIASYYGLGFIVTILTIFSGVSLFYFNSLFLFDALGVSADKNIYAIVLMIVFVALFNILFSLLRSAVMALVFATATCPTELKNYDPKFIEAIEEEKRKSVPRDAAGNEQAAAA